MPGHLLEVVEQPAAETDATPVRVDPHAFDLGRGGVEALQPAAPDRTQAIADDDERAVRRTQGDRIRDERIGRIEPRGEALLELGEVSSGRLARVGRARIGVDELNGGGAQQPLGRGQSVVERQTLAVGQRRDEPTGVLFGESVEPLPFPPPGGGEMHQPLPPVGRVGDNRNEAFAFELAEQTADVAGVEPQPPAQVDHASAIGPDLEQQPGWSQRSSRVEVRVVEHPDALGEATTEPSEHFDISHDP